MARVRYMVRAYVFFKLGKCVLRRTVFRLSSSLLNIICYQIGYQSKSDYMDRALEYLLTISLFTAMYETISKFHKYILC